MTVARSSGVLALALLGDALLYVALPVDAPVFGVSAGSVGVLLSANRLVRIVSYGAIARVAERLGPRRLTLLAAVAATISTIGYGVVQGVVPLLVLRLLWGLAFGALSLTTIVYAVEEPTRAGARVGASRALTAMGPLLALSGGPLIAAQWGSRAAFVVLGALTMLAIPLAASLPGGRAAVARPVDGRRQRRMGFLSRRSFLTWWSFTVGFAVDGVFAVSFALLVATLVPVRTAMALTGLVLAARYAAEIVLAPLAGRLADRLGAMPMLRWCSALVAAGFLLMASDRGFALWAGAATVVVGRGLLLPLGSAALAVAPPRAGNGSGSAFRDHGDLAAWRDLGAALGPLVAGWAAISLPTSGLYAALAFMIITVLLARRPSSLLTWLRGWLPAWRRLRPLPASRVSLDNGEAHLRAAPGYVTTATGVDDADRIPAVLPRAHDHARADRPHVRAGGDGVGGPEQRQRITAQRPRLRAG